MKLKAKLLKWSAGIPVVMLNKNTASQIGVHALERISIKTISKHPKEMSTIVDITGDGKIKENEIAISTEIQKRIELRNGQKIDVNFASIPQSLTFIKKKLNKEQLSEKEINEIVKDIVNNSLSDAEIALFVSAMYEHGLVMKETIFLINSILKSGNKLKLRKKFITDKYSIGGIPGNRTTPLVVSICAAAGLTMPKNSSRAITSAAGTADVIETIAKVEFSIDELKKIIKKTNACMVLGGYIGLVPADSEIIRVEKMVGIDPEAQLLASIMSKKLAVGSKYILIDIPYGKTAKVSKKKAIDLKKKFEYLGNHYKKKLKCVLTDGSQPIGNGIGPVLELIDIIKILDPKENGPKDLEKKSLFLSGEILEMTGKAKKGNGSEMARKILYSGKAFRKFKQIIAAQEGNLKKIKKAKFKTDIFIKKGGKIIEIDNIKLNSLARITGCPVDKSAGLYLHHHVGNKLNKNEKILTIYSESKSRLKQAIKFYKEKNPIKIKYFY